MTNLIVTMGFGESDILPEGVLSQGSLSINIKRSFEQYIKSNLGGAGFNVDYEGLPFDDTAYSEWIRPRIIEMPREYHRQGSSTEYGQTNNVFFSVDINVKKSGATTTDRHYILRDDVVNYFRVGQDVPLRDYAASGSTLICSMRVRDMTDDNSLEDDPDLLKYKVGFEMDFTEMVTEP